MSQRIHPWTRVAAALAIALAAAFAAFAPAQAAPKADRRAERLPIRETSHVSTGLENLERQVRDFTLPNGYKFIVVERHQAPVFSFFTVVNAGSANDTPGTTGLAHMMEHMAFKGTDVVGSTDYSKEKPLLDAEETAWNALLAERQKGDKADKARLKQLEQAFADAQTASHRYVNSNEFSKVLEGAGAENMNAYTANDLTAYFFSIPSNRLELWALMEAGELSRPVFREFYKERDVVYEERRMRTESSPVGRLIDEFIHASYVAHPYGYGGIGFPSDLHSFSRTQGEAYFKKYYVAKDMVTAVVGDVALPQVKDVTQKYFGGISDAPAPPPIPIVEPEQRAERRVILEDNAQPVVIIGWHIPAASDPHYGAYKAVADLLAGGDYARLNKKLVKHDKIATQVQAFTDFPGEKYPHQMGFFVVPAAGQDPAKVEQAVYAVLNDVEGAHPFTAEELAGYKVRVKADKIAAAEKNDDLASELAQAQTLYGDWHQFFREQERVQALTTAELMDVMKNTMTRSNRTVGMLVPPSNADNAPQASGSEGGH
ncbi:MAG TPA: pitrilysin family protein [Candidatus Eisenbacteria bacterium]|nr:pitrilysin family protein [Candidatus Eisenbacteria bacterium]